MQFRSSLATLVVAGSIAIFSACAGPNAQGFAGPHVDDVKNSPDQGVPQTSRRQQQNIALAQRFLKGIRGGQDPTEIAALFDADLVFEIQGDVGVLPWIGHKTGRQVMADFIREMRALTEPIAFDVEDIVAGDNRAVILGRLQTRIKATGKTTATQFAIILTIKDDDVTHFQMLEDSFDVSKAARR